MKLEDLEAVTTKINIFNTTKPKSGTPVRTNIVQELPVSIKGSLAWKDSYRIAFPTFSSLYPY
jgi:hypothetical protein